MANWEKLCNIGICSKPRRIYSYWRNQQKHQWPYSALPDPIVGSPPHISILPSLGSGTNTATVSMRGYGWWTRPTTTSTLWLSSGNLLCQLRTWRHSLKYTTWFQCTNIACLWNSFLTWSWFSNKSKLIAFYSYWLLENLTTITGRQLS